jgi:hypothetical protein
MSTDEPLPTSTRADLDYLTSLVQGDGRIQTVFAAGYLVGGVVWGLQTLLMWAAYAGLVELGRWGGLAAVALPTIGVIAFFTWLGRRMRPAKTDLASRAISAAFSGSTLATGAIFAAFIILAVRAQSGVLWLVYAPVIFAIQGGVWFVAYRLRRRLWLLAVALGWLTSAVAMAAAAAELNINAYIGIALLDLFVLMALPGAVMLHLARRSAP